MSIKSPLSRQFGSRFDSVFDVVKSNPVYDKAGRIPTLDLNFAKSKSLYDGRSTNNLIDHVRDTAPNSSTYVDAAGLIKRSVTNLLLRSEEFDNAYWTKTNTTIVSNSIANPLTGKFTADTLVATANSGSHFLNRNITSSANSTVSVYAKAAGYNYIEVNGYTNGVNQNRVTVNLTDGTVENNTNDLPVSVTSVGNGWYRIALTLTNGGSYVTFGISTDGTVNHTFTGDGTSGIYIWGAQLEQSSTVGEYVKTTATKSSAPRFDHDPVTGESLGLLVEEERTNEIRNNTMQGAVVGAPGTLPTNWGIGSIGLTYEVVELGQENGIDYIDVRLYGTTTVQYGNIPFDAVGQISAGAGQSWTISSYFKLVAGSFDNLAQVGHVIWEYDSGDNYITNTTTAHNITNTLTRYSHTRGSTSSDTTTVRPGFYFNGSNASGDEVDFTIRIGLPQIELGSFRTSVIPTESAAVTRGADVASITGTNFSGFYNQSDGTLYSALKTLTDTPDQYSNAWELQKSDNTDRLFVRYPNYVGWECQGQTDLYLTRTFAQDAKMAVAYKTNDTSFAVNSSYAQDTTVTIGETKDELWVGSSGSGNHINGTISRITYWDTRLPNEKLQSTTA